MYGSRGGAKLSFRRPQGTSYGPREHGAYAREFYTTVKTAYTSAA